MIASGDARSGRVQAPSGARRPSTGVAVRPVSSAKADDGESGPALGFGGAGCRSQGGSSRVAVMAGLPLRRGTWRGRVERASCDSARFVFAVGFFDQQRVERVANEIVPAPAGRLFRFRRSR